MILSQKENGVSPVIGTVLMVAITVILAAVGGAFAFGLLGHTQTPRQLGMLTVNQNTNDIIINYHGGPDHDELEWIRINAPDGRIFFSTANGITEDPGSKAKPNIGTSFILTGQATSAKDRVVIVAHFNDGYEQLEYDGGL